MELDRALELAVVSSWDDLVKPGEDCSMTVEYENVTGTPLKSLEVWTKKSRGHGTLVCRYSDASSAASSRSDGALIYFANSYCSKKLSEGLAFIMRNQDGFTRQPSFSIHGRVKLDRPSHVDRNDAAIWSQETRTDPG